MNKNLIKKKYFEKIKLINYYNKKYYSENLSIISDAEYDKLKKEILDLENLKFFFQNLSNPLLKKHFGVTTLELCVKLFENF